MHLTKRTCPVCGGDLPANKPKQTYCSPHCWGRARDGRSMPRHRKPTFNTCPTCGKQFPTGRPTGKPRDAIYCSQQCAGEAQRKYDVCVQCGKRFRNRRKAGDRLYCSRDCYGFSLVGMGKVELVCVGCGVAFEVPTKNNVRQYCSINCRRATGTGHLRGADHPNWKGGTFISHGYVYEQDLTRPAKSNGSPNYRRQHVRVMEDMLGRKLECGEHVHHLDGDTQHNDPSNLMPLKAGAHTALHQHFMHEYMREHAAAGDLEAITRAFIDSHT